MRIVQAEERKEIDIAISEVVKDGGKLSILPNVKNYFSIDYKPKNDKLSLVAGGFIGLIPITSDLAVEIKPKFSIQNLTRIVGIAEDNFNTLNFFSKKYRKSNEKSPVIFEFMAECLAIELQTLVTEGLIKDYIAKTDETYKIRGRININKSIKSLWSHGHFNKVSISYFDFTLDNPFNRLIKMTLKFCIEELNLIQSNKLFLRESLIEYYSMFDAVALDDGPSCLDSVFNEIRNDKVSVLRNYYINISEICRLILNRTSISFDKDGDDHKLSSFTLNMETIFEKYLLNSIRANRTVFDEGATILDGNNEGRKKFYNQPSLASGDAKPDIIVNHGDRCLIIADAKYKDKTKETDRYQIISHALSFDAKIAVLILPKNNNHNGDTLQKLGCIGGSFQIDVYEYYFDLASNNLEHEERVLTEAFAGLIRNSNEMTADEAAVSA